MRQDELNANIAKTSSPNSQFGLSQALEFRSCGIRQLQLSPPPSIVVNTAFAIDSTPRQQQSWPNQRSTRSPPTAPPASTPPNSRPASQPPSTSSRPTSPTSSLPCGPCSLSQPERYESSSPWRSCINPPTDRSRGRQESHHHLRPGPPPPRLPQSAAAPDARAREEVLRPPRPDPRVAPNPAQAEAQQQKPHEPDAEAAAEQDPDGGARCDPG